MAIRVLYPNVGESDVIQPGSITQIIWDFSDVLVDDEVVATVSATVTDNAGADASSVAGDAVIIAGARDDAAVCVPLTGHIDGERYKIKITATISTKKVEVVTVFVPVVAP